MKLKKGKKIFIPLYEEWGKIENVREDSKGRRIVDIRLNDGDISIFREDELEVMGRGFMEV